MSRVGHFLGKLFAGQTGKNETPLRAYGKLPYYAEYRRLEVAPGTPTAYSQWMDAGRLAWVRALAGGSPGEVHPSRLLLQLPGTREVVVASIWDSHDNLGRVFPFSFFVVCPPEALGDNSAQRWAAALALHESFDRFYRELNTLGGGGDFYRLFRARIVTLRPDDLGERVRRLHDEARKITTQDWFGAAGFGDDVSTGEWFASVGRRVARWKAQPELVGELALSCPLARGYPYATQAVVWLSLVEKLAKSVGRAPALVVPADAERARASLHLLIRDPLPGDFQLLTSDAPGYNYVENLAQVPPKTADAPESSSPSVPTGSMLAWLAECASKTG